MSAIVTYQDRVLDLKALMSRRSLFLFGPRQTGKSTLALHGLPGAQTYSLLDSDVFLSLNRRPARLREELADQGGGIVVIDEIQKLPALLDEVHLLIERQGIRFLLTGSSARKLRRGGVNLLGGRARVRTLHPFIRREFEKFDLRRALDIGLLPSVYLSDAPIEDLRAYAGTYLKEEIASEGLTRNLPAFSRVLEVAALSNGQLMNHAAIASDAQVARSTVQQYFQILKDTLIATELPAWTNTLKRKAIRKSKLYFFDVGVVRHLQHRRGLRSRAPEFGEAFETYIHHELRSYLDYAHPDGELNYWRSRSGFEVDFILDHTTAIEVKAKTNVGERDLRGLRALAEEGLMANLLLVSLDERPSRIGDIQILPWQEFLGRLWEGHFI